MGPHGPQLENHHRMSACYDLVAMVYRMNGNTLCTHNWLGGKGERGRGKHAYKWVEFLPSTPTGPVCTTPKTDDFPLIKFVKYHYKSPPIRSLEALWLFQKKVNIFPTVSTFDQGFAIVDDPKSQYFDCFFVITSRKLSTVCEITAPYFPDVSPPVATPHVTPNSPYWPSCTEHSIPTRPTSSLLVQWNTVIYAQKLLFRKAITFHYIGYQILIHLLLWLGFHRPSHSPHLMLCLWTIIMILPVPCFSYYCLNGCQASRDDTKMFKSRFFVENFFRLEVQFHSFFIVSPKINVNMHNNIFQGKAINT